MYVVQRTAEIYHNHLMIRNLRSAFFILDILAQCSNKKWGKMLWQIFMRQLPKLKN